MYLPHIWLMSSRNMVLSCEALSVATLTSSGQGFWTAVYQADHSIFTEFSPLRKFSANASGCTPVFDQFVCSEEAALSRTFNTSG